MSQMSSVMISTLPAQSHPPNQLLKQMVHAQPLRQNQLAEKHMGSQRKGSKHNRNSNPPENVLSTSPHQHRQKFPSPPPNRNQHANDRHFQQQLKPTRRSQPSGKNIPRLQRRRELKALAAEAEALGDPEQQHADMMFGAGSPPRRAPLFDLIYSDSHATLSPPSSTEVSPRGYPRNVQPNQRRASVTKNEIAPAFPSPNTTPQRTPSQPTSQLYAGPTFHNSPAPSALPVPTFNGRSPTLDALSTPDISPLKKHHVTKGDDDTLFHLDEQEYNSNPDDVDFVHADNRDEMLRAKSRQLMNLLVAAGSNSTCTPARNVPVRMVTAHDIRLSPQPDEYRLIEMSSMLMNMLKIESN
ncbi:uncharacterized protein VTP21DRAFT_1786 [Calcarisporiella thermophila]|uniref:uncharacterized protein n=1 Tax=Calcarisporiella thermophila TaxID=911321 RepID=UPI00374485F9